MIRAIRNHILFEFEDDAATGFFEHVTDGGIVMARHHSTSAKEPRWVKPLSVGPDCDEELKTATKMLVEPLAWTLGEEFEGRKIWKTDETRVMAYEL